MSIKARIIGFFAIAIAMFIGTLDSTIINIALPDIQSYFNASMNDASWICTIYVLGLSVFMIPASKLADQFGRKKVMIMGLLLFGISSALCGISESLIFLIFMRMIQGIGGAIITPIVIPMALELFGKEKTQFVAGAVGAVTALAAAGGPPIGGLLIKYINWQAIFFVNVPFTIISLFLTLIFIIESYDETTSKKIDWIGMLLLTSTLFLLTFALLKGEDFGWDSFTIVFMLIGSGVSLVLFILAEMHVKSPLVELGLFKEITFTMSSVCYLITGIGIVGPILIFNYFLQNLLGYEALSAAYIIVAVSLTVIASMPLGSIIAGKLGAIPVNFIGILSMGAALLLLSRLTVSSLKSTMIIDLIVFGFGLGFSCQSLVSAIKHLPEKKSGIASGVVNAARQIGTCIGIALLVSVLNSNVQAAKTEIKNDAIAEVNKSNIDVSIKSVIINDITNNLDNKDNTKSTEQDELQEKLQSDIENALLSSPTVIKPVNELLKKLYDGTDKIDHAVKKVNDGQNNLTAGIENFSTGLYKLSDGSRSLSTGIGTLDNGVSRLLSGAITMNTESKKGIGTLVSGIDQLDNGAQKLQAQFSPGYMQQITVYDVTVGLADGTKSLSQNLNSYVSAVDSTYYLMIKSNPASPQLLAQYKNTLKEIQAAFEVSSDEKQKEQYQQQLTSLSSLITLYSAGTDPSVTNEKQFEEKLLKLAYQNPNSSNIVSTGNQIISGTEKLAGISEKVKEQFSDGGTFKNGMLQLCDGISLLNDNSKKLLSVQAGIDKITSGLSGIKSGSGQLLNGSENLENGLSSLISGSDKLLSGSKQLSEANMKIKDGTDSLMTGMSTAGQANEIKDLINDIKSNKDDKATGAFSHTFLLSAIILAAASVCGLFTDRRV